MREALRIYENRWELGRSWGRAREQPGGYLMLYNDSIGAPRTLARR